MNQIKNDQLGILDPENMNESQLERYLIKNLHLIEDGLEFIDRQYKVQNGFIDILARDKNNKLCIIELKVVKNDKSLLFQSTYCPTQFNEETRMITITSGYTKRIKEALKSLKHVEMMEYYFDDNDRLSIKKVV